MLDEIKSVGVSVPFVLTNYIFFVELPHQAIYNSIKKKKILTLLQNTN